MLPLFLTLLVAFSGAAEIRSDPNAIEELSNYNSITDEFIENINAAQNTWTAGYNFPPGTKFSDLKTLCGTKLGNLPPAKQVKVLDEIPESFDAREHWPKCNSIREIKNQGHCGSCWAVSSATTMSDRLCISSNGKFNTDISAQNIVSCSGGNGCHGGWPLLAWSYFVHQGAPTGGDFDSNQGCQPYLVEPCINRTASNRGPKKCPSTDYVETPACQKICYNTHYHQSFAKDLHFGKSAHSVSRDVKQIQAEIMTNGPVVCAIEVYNDFLTYSEGVYEHKLGKKLAGHAMRILGWGVENGVDYWLIANQWGVEWGINGTVKFLRGSNHCGVESNIVAGMTGRY